MTDEFIPGTASVRIAYAYIDEFNSDVYRSRQAAFDRWLAEVRAKAWDEGFNAGELDAMSHETFDEPCITNPYRKDAPK